LLDLQLPSLTLSYLLSLLLLNSLLLLSLLLSPLLLHSLALTLALLPDLLLLSLMLLNPLPLGDPLLFLLILRRLLLWLFLRLLAASAISLCGCVDGHAEQQTDSQKRYARESFNVI